MCTAPQTSCGAADAGHRPLGWSAAGLRLTEATHLRVADIDSERMQLKVMHGKGDKQRLVPLSPRLLQELRSYWKQTRPTQFLFPGKTPEVPLSSATIQKACMMGAALGGHVYQCPQCLHRCPVYNSCVDRHCPQCSGGRSADWLDKTAQLLLPSINYFQVVFTLPDKLSALMLGNRRETYGLLFHAAWDALREVLREELGCEPAALMVLHSWNQHLGHYPHIHALVPGGGPSLDGQQWVPSRHRDHPGRDQPYLVDHKRLSERFRDKFLAGLTRLHRADKLKLEGEWAHLQDSAAFTAWLKTFRDGPWVVLIEPRQVTRLRWI